MTVVTFHSTKWAGNTWRQIALVFQKFLRRGVFFRERVLEVR